MNEEKVCCICNGKDAVEETVLFDAHNNQRTILCCEQCFITGRIFELEPEQ